MRLSGKVAIVTGGARDLGRAISVKLAAEGAKVCLNYFDNPEDAEKTLAMIKADGGEAIAVRPGRRRRRRSRRNGTQPTGRNSRPGTRPPHPPAGAG